MARNYWYVIRVDGQEVWRGKHTKGVYWDFKKKNPNKKVSIEWESDDDLLVVAYPQAAYLYRDFF